MSSRARLSEDEITAALAGLPRWTREGDSIVRSAVAPDFPAAIRAVVAVAEQAEALDHHPDIDIRWRSLRFVLSTHSAGGLTGLDLTLAARIDEALRAESADA
ncbi:4a-hydroxytetrahydrobiopterin dehydratase [Streptomyces rubellomurinus]|uniref:Putative pterin-4-alpha-carbinolamine dehydratase n=2 Tax=Streptomyces TaxID=1883 RepID=A0A0F2TAY8_STRR3|nr:4a-hydroxytetrahydrobiopterin dehydratase [Streptomyces rubellomurinus]KJS56660.1 pterin-4-alpha-carbinolamine dehydratase [Streptomyces rubellomurinus subsp. indigoferus]KJS60374.1 pterin-4-alpha-carbinolamine dehydratase [Streptomyces rubellomurinus]